MGHVHMATMAMGMAMGPVFFMLAPINTDMMGNGHGPWPWVICMGRGPWPWAMAMCHGPISSAPITKLED